MMKNACMHFELRENHKGLYGVLEHKSANISPPNCNRMLIFGKQAFFVILFPIISSNPIISQI